MRSLMIMLLVCSVTMSALALFYMALTPLLAKRYSATGRYYAWLVLVAGLVIPFRPRFHNAVVKVNMPGQASATTIQIGNRAPVAVPAEPALSSTFSHLAWWQAAAAIWLAGMLLFLVYHAIKHVRFSKLAARWSVNVTDEQTLALFQNLKKEMGVSRDLRLQICDSIGGPMMIGFIRPRILLPKADFAKEELRLILKHELVHDKRKDLWYKCLILLATAIHWFNPIVYLMTKAIGVQCEASCDEEVVRGTDAETRQYYSETIISVVRYRSKRRTALSTHFYGGKKGMKQRIFSIMDMSKKKSGLAVLCGALVLTLGTGGAFATNAKTQIPPAGKNQSTAFAPSTAVSFLPNPDVYAAYAAFGITISEDGTKLLYDGQPVRLFADDGSDTEAFYLNEAGHANLSAVRNGAGQITGIQSISAQKAQAYQDAFFADERFANVQDRVTVQENVTVGPNKYEQYQPFGVTYSEADEALYYNGQRVKSFVDQLEDGWFGTLWTDAAGTVNLAAIRDGVGEITGIESISDEKAQEYWSKANDYEQDIVDRLEKKYREE